MSATSDKDPRRMYVGRRLGRYEVLGRLASGGMAEVYVARARAQGVARFGRLVAIKVLHANLAHEQDFIEMFFDEARLAARIRHPNVAATLDISKSESAGYFLVMEYIEGDHLGGLVRQAFRQKSRLPAGVTGRIMSDALAGLAAAHRLEDEQGRRLNLVHRDISPHNIMVGADGVARLTDFGVARAEDRLSHTRDGQVKGKLAYMAPEHAGQGVIDQRADLFSMGIVLWECLAGRRLFRAPNAAATLHKLLHEPIPVLSKIDPALAELDPLLDRALARDPQQRFADADEFADALEEGIRRIGGLGSHHKVRDCVRRFAYEKLTRDQAIIRTGLESIGDAEEVSSALELVELSEPSLPRRPSDPSSSGVFRQTEGSHGGSSHSGTSGRFTGTDTQAELAALAGVRRPGIGTLLAWSVFLTVLGGAAWVVATDGAGLRDLLSPAPPPQQQPILAPKPVDQPQQAAPDSPPPLPASEALPRVHQTGPPPADVRAPAARPSRPPPVSSSRRGSRSGVRKARPRPKVERAKAPARRGSAVRSQRPG
ncbi:MAG: serine/threonine protein kinase, partial [Proteobacteria bacterium]|nr:serine/threonine protein kinase [Pseudomonadota bacterium]